MMKAKFADAIRSDSDAAMVDEALCKILCQNVCCQIQSMRELGIVATFWGPDEGPAGIDVVGKPDDDR